MNRRHKGILGGHRRAGVLLHLASLPHDDYQPGLQRSARRFIDFLQAAGLSVWQMLPIGPSHGGSPYDLASAHAGNPSCVSDEPLPACLPEELTAQQGVERLEAAFAFCEARGLPEELEIFLAEQSGWLDDYALYQTLKEREGGRPWWEWPQPLRDREEQALAPVRASADFRRQRFWQWLFFHQWGDLRHYARSKGVLLFGDMPFFVGHDSADVWAHRELFRLDAHGHPEVVAGVPPDYFSADGQRWGNPLYRWDVMEQQGFLWWRERLKTQLALFDLLRIDHFRGLEACWEIPAGAPTAAAGHWDRVPGQMLLDSLEKLWGNLPVVAEDLGVITDAVTELRDRHGFAGMKVLQFAFGDDARNPYLPHNHVRNAVVYTGTHDNDTTVGWFAGLAPGLQQRVHEYLGGHESMPWALVRAAMASVADLAVIPMQDLLALDSAHRMNTPGSARGNWAYRLSWADIPDDLAGRLRHMMRIYDRERSAAD
ncbi:MAG: 4-alpha-glucanotransferase [Gammaproteobacteria bacterium]|nr:4-alpha-glucanotransferase [Gammaproteobacteria bacterium]